MPEVRFEGFSGEWNEVKLESIFGKIRNAFVGTATPYYVEDGHFYLESNNIKNGQINRKAEVFINDEFYEKQRDNWLHTDDLVMVQSGHVGHTAVIPKELNNTAAHALIMFSNYRKETNPHFLNYQFQNQKSKKKLGSITTGNTIKHILSSEMKKFLVDIPNFVEQTQIGHFFKQLDETIALHQQELDTLKQTKQGFLQKMFPKEGESVPEVRFAGFSGEWEQIRLGEKAIIKGRLGWKSLKQEEYTTEGPSMIAGKHIKNGVINWTSVDHIPQWRYDESPEIMLEDGDVIFSKDGSLGNPALISNLKGPATINSTMMLVRVDETIDSEFFYQVMKSEKFERLIYLKVSGSSIPHLFQADMNDFMFQAPSKLEQIKIGNFFKQLEGTIALQQQELNILKQTKKAFLQKMFV